MSTLRRHAVTCAALALCVTPVVGCSSGHAAGTGTSSTRVVQTFAPSSTGGSAAPAPYTVPGNANATAVPAGQARDLSAQQLANQLRDAGLPITVSLVYTGSTDSEHLLGRPGGYVSKVAFVDPRITAAGVPDRTLGSVWLGGAVEVFSTSADAQRRADHLRHLASSIDSEEYVYVRGTVVLRVSHNLDATYADGYGKLLVRTG